MTKDMGKKITWGLLSLAAVVMAGCQEDGYIDPNRGLVPIYLTATVSEGSGIAATRAGAVGLTTDITDWDDSEDAIALENNGTNVLQ